MNGALRVMGSAKGQLAFRLFLVALCLLITLAPRLSEPTPTQPSTLIISTNTPNYTFLANYQRGDSDGYRVRNTGSNYYRLPLHTSVDVLYARLLSLTLSTLSVRISLFDDFSPGNFHQACRLLDLPPPALV